MSLVSPQNKLKIEVCTICFKKIRDACFSPPQFGSTENVLFSPTTKKRWLPTYYFNKDMFVTKTEQDCGDFSMDIFCPQRATPSTVATCWIFFTGRRLDLKNDLPIFVVIFCHSELHQYVWGNSQMPRNNALWKCLFFFCCLFLQWLVYSCYWGPKTNTDRSNNAYSKNARFGARKGLLWRCICRSFKSSNVQLIPEVDFSRRSFKKTHWIT